jgi:1,4-dihydroxy-2-naphthoyl-CoA synthase
MASATDSALLLHSNQDGIATLTLSRPAQYDALATATMVCNMLAAGAAEGIDAFLQKRQPRWQDGN